MKPVNILLLGVSILSLAGVMETGGILHLAGVMEPVSILSLVIALKPVNILSHGVLRSMRRYM